MSENAYCDLARGFILLVSPPHNGFPTDPSSPLGRDPCLPNIESGMIR